jgi:hypothetical protein
MGGGLSEEGEAEDVGFAEAGLCSSMSLFPDLYIHSNIQLLPMRHHDTHYFSFQSEQPALLSPQNWD